MASPTSSLQVIRSVTVPLIVLTGQEQKRLEDVIEQHLDALLVTKEEIITGEDGAHMLEAVATVDEAIVLTESVLGKVQRGS